MPIYICEWLVAKKYTNWFEWRKKNWIQNVFGGEKENNVKMTKNNRQVIIFIFSFFLIFNIHTKYDPKETALKN